MKLIAITVITLRRRRELFDDTLWRFVATGLNAASTIFCHKIRSNCKTYYNIGSCTLRRKKKRIEMSPDIVLISTVVRELCTERDSFYC